MTEMKIKTMKFIMHWIKSEILNIPIPINVQDGIDVQGGNFFSKLINVHARLFGTLE